MALCSEPTKVPIEAVPPTPYIIDLGDSFDVRQQFVTDKSGDVCTQTLIYWQTRDGATSLTLWAIEPNASEDIWYTEAFTPTLPGKYVITGEVQYLLTGPPPIVEPQVLRGTQEIILQVESGEAPPWNVESRRP